MSVSLATLAIMLPACGTGSTQPPPDAADVASNDATPDARDATAAADAVDASDPCAEPRSPLRADVTLTANCSPYVFGHSLLVAPGVTLTIEAGTTVQFATSAELRVGGDARLVVDGTTTSPVLLGPAAGVTAWAGLTLGPDATTGTILRSELHHLRVSNGEVFIAPGTGIARVVLDDLAVDGAGVVLGGNTQIDSTSGPPVFSVTGANGYPLVVEATLLGTLPAHLSVASASTTQNAISVVDPGAGVVSNVTWAAQDVPFEINDLTVHGRLTITPPATLNFASGAGINAADGELIAVGTAAQPIVFGPEATGTSPDSYWHGITLGPTASDLEFVTVRHAGSGDSAALYIAPGASCGTGPVVRNCTFSEHFSSGAGLGPFCLVAHGYTGNNYAANTFLGPNCDVYEDCP